MFDRTIQAQHFKNHIATLTDCGNIKILDFKNPENIYYRIRFIFEEDFCKLHISGDLGELSATNYKNMCYEHFSDFVHNPGYFREKIDCASRPLYSYSSEFAIEELKKRLAEYEDEFDITSSCYDTVDEYIADFIDELMYDFNENTGFGSKAYEQIEDIIPDAWEWLSDIGKEATDIVEMYLLAFELAYAQLNGQNKDEED